MSVGCALYRIHDAGRARFNGGSPRVTLKVFTALAPPRILNAAGPRSFGCRAARTLMNRDGQAACSSWVKAGARAYNTKCVRICGFVDEMVTQGDDLRPRLVDGLEAGQR